VEKSKTRAHFSKIGFILAAAGSAIGLGNIWKFPYITGMNGGGLFVLIYLVCIVLIGLPIMIAEITLGRTAQKSPVGAFKKFSEPGSLWVSFGFLGVISAFVILSYYSVVAGWSLEYIVRAMSNSFAGVNLDNKKVYEKYKKIYVNEKLEQKLNELMKKHNLSSAKAIELDEYKNYKIKLQNDKPSHVKAYFISKGFGSLITNNGRQLMWHILFMLMTIGIVICGVKKGVERWSKILMPLLFIMMLTLLFKAFTMKGFAQGFKFVFGFHADKLTASGILEALGHSFFTLSLGMGAMLTYGSYLSKDEDVVSSSILISISDTLIALMACLILFPITFTFGMKPAAGPGLVFKNIPIALSQMPGAFIFAPVFFFLLAFAALTSAISLLEVAAAYFIDEKGMSRVKATLLTGAMITILGIPSALSGGTDLFGKEFQAIFSRNWFDLFDYIASNWLLTVGALGIALFVAWRMGGEARKQGFSTGSKFKNFYHIWLWLLRYLVPVGIVLIILNKIGAFN